MSEREAGAGASGDKTGDTDKGKKTDQLSKEDRLAKQLRDNLARRKSQSRARNTKPRKFKS